MGKKSKLMWLAQLILVNAVSEAEREERKTERANEREWTLMLSRLHH